MSTLSVEISTIVSPSLTASPTFTAHSRIVPSVTLSLPAGVTMSTTSAASVLGSLVRPARRPAPLAAEPFEPFSEIAISASGLPTPTVSPSAA